MGATQSTEHPYLLETPKGKLQGIEQRDKSGKPILRRFLKIPFAQPPIGELRWRRPQPLSSEFTFDHGGKPGDYTTFGPICPQPEYNTGAAEVDNPNAGPEPENVQSEDCLYLNIWVPAGTPPEKGWPVQVFLHGGWLQVGNANQSNSYDPFDLLSNATPRVIVAPTYRLNILGFAAGSDLASAIPDAFAGNFGFWDQRLALEWTHANIAHFNGDPNLITVGGLSAGSQSAFLQLYHDTYLPASRRIIKQAYLYSNALAIQPNPTTSTFLTTQFDDLCTAVSISTSLSPSEKLTKLRSVPWKTLIAAIPKLRYHTFRASTDGPISSGGFIPANFLSSIHDGTFATQLAQHGVRIMLGEVRDEALLYKLVNPPSNRDDLITQVANYYPSNVADALVKLPLYGIPGPDDAEGVPAKKWADWFATIVADGQVHASIRGLSKCLLNPPKAKDVVPLPQENLFRYRIEWRAKALDDWLKPKVKCCHASDCPIWWCSGFRAGYNQNDRETCLSWVAPFGKFLEGKSRAETGWDGVDSPVAEVDEVRLLKSDGNIQEGVKDPDWDRGLGVWEAIWDAQKEDVERG